MRERKGEKTMFWKKKSDLELQDEIEVLKLKTESAQKRKFLEDTLAKEKMKLKSLQPKSTFAVIKEKAIELDKKLKKNKGRSFPIRETSTDLSDSFFK